MRSERSEVRLLPGAPNDNFDTNLALYILHIPKRYDIDKLKFIQQNISRARGRGKKAWNIEIDKFDVYEVGEQQEWLCAITKTPLEFSRGGTTWQNNWCNPNSCVIDRVDSSKHYSKDNIQLLTHKANTWKSNFTNEELKFLSESFLKNA